MAKVKKIKEERLEDILMSCRNHLRGKSDQSDKRDVLLTLVFLKFMSDRFEEQARAYARVTGWLARAYARVTGRLVRAYARVTERLACAYARVTGRPARAYARWGLADG